MHKVMREGSLIEINNRLPILPLKDVVIFPYMIYPLLVGRESSLKAIEESMLLDKHIFLAAQKNVTIEEPGKRDLYRTGVIARVLQVVKLPNGLMKVLVEGIVRGKIKRFLALDDHFQAEIDLISESKNATPKIKAKGRRVSTLFKEYVRLNRNIPDEIVMTIEKVEEPQRLADLIAAHLQRDIDTKQKILETNSVEKEFLELISILESEMEILKLEKELEEKVRGRINKSQRSLYLQEQMRVIQDELGEDGEFDGELAFLSERIKRQK